MPETKLTYDPAKVIETSADFGSRAVCQKPEWWEHEHRVAATKAILIWKGKEVEFLGDINKEL